MAQHIVVCDYDPRWSDEFDMAAKHPYDIDGYCDGKEAFVQRMEADALTWKRG